MSENSYLSPTCVPEEVGGQVRNFYPVSVGAAFAMRSVAKPLAKALTVLFADTTSDVGMSTKNIGAENGVGFVAEKSIEPITLSMAEMRLRVKQEAIENLIEAVTADANRAVLARLMQDSLRDEFPRNGKAFNATEAVKWFDNIDLPTLRLMLLALGKANKEVFGPLGEKLSGAARAAVDSALQSAPQTSSPEKAPIG